MCNMTEGFVKYHGCCWQVIFSEILVWYQFWKNSRYCFGHRYLCMVSVNQLLLTWCHTSCKTLFAHNFFCSWRICLQFCTEHSSNTAVLCTKLQKGLFIIMDVMDKVDLWFRMDYLCRFRPQVSLHGCSKSVAVDMVSASLIWRQPQELVIPVICVYGWLGQLIYETRQGWGRQEAVSLHRQYW